jgi:hypothetical protein
MHFKLPPIDFEQTPKQARRRGVFLIIVGLLLIGFVSLVSAVVADVIPLSTFFPGVYRDPNAGPTVIPLAAWLFLGFFIVFGLVSVVQGIWQVAYGERNRMLTIVMITMAAIFIGGGIIARSFK